MPYYESKPQIVEAIQYTGYNSMEVGLFTRHPDEEPLTNTQMKLLSENVEVPEGEEPAPISIRAGKDGAQGLVEVPPGHYVVHKPGDYTDFWPVHPDYFEEKYQRIEHPEWGDSGQAV